MLGVFVQRQVSALTKAGFDATVLSPVARGRSVRTRGNDGLPTDASWPAKHATIDGVEVRYMPFRHVPHMLSIRLEVRALTRSLISETRRLTAEGRTYDVIHAYWAMPMGAAALEVGRVLGLPVVLSVLGCDINTYPHRNRRVRSFTRRTLTRCTRVVAVSSKLAEEVRRLVAREGWPEPRVVYNGVDIDEFRPTDDQRSERVRLGLPADGTGFCCVARLVKEKGIWELLEAFHELRSRVPDVWLALVGGGPLRRGVEEWVATRDLQDAVILAGSQDPERVVDWLRAADAFVLPSFSEGLPNSVLEAMACGLPVIATTVGGIPEAVADGEDGLLVEAGDVVGLMAALWQLATDRELRESMGQRGLDKVKTEFSWISTVECLRTVYCAAIHEHAERGGSCP
jgi:glycosyltransferase involved in cell wall biosynthesis